MTKKFIIFLTISFLALFIPTMAFTTGGKEAEAAVSSTGPIVFPLIEPHTLTFVMAEHPTVGAMEFGATGMAWMEKATNVKLDIQQIPYGSVDEKYQLMFATDDLPDFLTFTSSNYTDSDVFILGEQGSLVDVLADKVLVPNLIRMAQELIGIASKIRDGKLYGYPQIEQGLGLRVPCYIEGRNDIFRGTYLNMSDGFDSWNDFYYALKDLKSKEPSKYPFGAFNGEDKMLFGTAPIFGTSTGMYADQRINSKKKDEWQYGPLNDEYKDWLEFMHKLWEEGLMHPDTFTMSMQQFQNLAVNDQIYLGLYWGVPSKWNLVGINQDPKWDFEKRAWITIQPPKNKDGLYGTGGWTLTNPALSKHGVNAKSPNARLAVAYLDFLMDDKNQFRAQWGEMGGTWHIVNGKARINDTNVQVPYNPPDATKSWGDFTKEKKVSEFPIPVHNNRNMWYGQMWAFGENDYDIDNDQRVALHLAHNYYCLTPQPLTDFPVEVAEEKNQLETVLETYVEENTILFITGQRPLSEFNQFKAKLRELGAEKLVSLYKQYSRSVKPYDPYADYMKK